jgi:hypothetical protein
MSSKWAEAEKERILRKRNPQNAEDVKQNMLEKRERKGQPQKREDRVRKMMNTINPRPTQQQELREIKASPSKNLKVNNSVRRQMEDAFRKKRK